jgi:hypothetical protein
MAVSVTGLFVAPVAEIGMLAVSLPRCRLVVFGCPVAVVPLAAAMVIQPVSAPVYVMVPTVVSDPRVPVPALYAVTVC